MTLKNEYVFKNGAGNRLIFVGDFDGLYINENDPWDQSGGPSPMAAYYKAARGKLVQTFEMLYSEGPFRVLDVGCGLGYAANHFSKIKGSQVFGIDISKEALKRAWGLFPHIGFLHADIRDTNSMLEVYDIWGQFNVLVLNQILWYILDDLDAVFENCRTGIRPGQHLIISQFFLKDQRYGKKIIDGFYGMMKYVTSKQKDTFDVIECILDPCEYEFYKDGFILLRRI